MTRLKAIGHKFVDVIPDRLEDGVLYISTAYATAMHKCACGCGELVVTPIKIDGWVLLWDGRTVTLDPSIGNWSLPCSSHYFIRRGRIVWAKKWRTVFRRAKGKRKRPIKAASSPGWLDRMFKHKVGD